MSLSTGGIIGIVVVFFIIIASICVLSKFADVFRGVAEIARALNKTDLSALEAEIETTPKSVSGMTSLCIPRISADFPEFNWYEFRQKAENMLKSSFRAISENDISLLQNASGELQNQISLVIKSNLDAQTQEIFRDVTVHQTEIRDYKKVGGNCIITLQSSVGMLHYKKKAGGLTEGSETNLCQKRYNIELIYIQDVDKITNRETAIGSNCPNCGAPIKTLGHKTCPYCGSALTEVNIHVWSIHRYYEA